MKLKLSVLTILLAILISTALTSPSLNGILNTSTSAAESYDIKNVLKSMTIDSPVAVASKELRKEMQISRSLELRDNLIDEYLEQLVSEYEEAAILKEEEAAKLKDEEIIIPQITEGKVAYLTFDDGPSPTITLQVLRVLDEYGIKATFFVVGSMAEKYPGILKQVWDKGHTIGNHTYSHVYDYIYKNSANFIADLKKAEQTFRNIIGEDFDSEIIRFPGGTHAMYKWETVKAAEEAGYKWFDWNTVNGDSEVTNPTTDYLMSRFLKTYGKRDVIIILMHDTESKQITVDTLPMIIEHLINEGYSFGTLDNYNH